MDNIVRKTSSRLLADEHGVSFNRLFAPANMPIKRFGSWLLSKGKFDDYLDTLRQAHREYSLDAVMCRSLISVDRRGWLYDCDFNQMLDVPIVPGRRSDERRSSLLSAKSPRRENPWLNLGLNVILPAVVLMKGKSWLEAYWAGTSDALTVLVFVLALSFPILYGAYDLLVRRKWNFFSILGLVGVLLTGGIGLLKLPPEWVAIKEATIPGIIGVVLLVSQFTSRPLISVFLFRSELFDIERIERGVREHGEEVAFGRLLRTSNGLFAASFFLSAVLNYVLAKVVVTSPAGSDAFNEELGRMTLLSYPVIALPTMLVTMFALWLLFHGIEKLTGLKADELVVHR